MLLHCRLHNDMKAVLSLLLAAAVGTWQCSAVTCPASLAYNGCYKQSCEQLGSSIICTDCGTGYVLVKGGTPGARCGEQQRHAAAACLK
jgi:hypothetical protein